MRREIDLGSPVSGYPITFAADGRQYVAVSTAAAANASIDLRMPRSRGRASATICSCSACRDARRLPGASRCMQDCLQTTGDSSRRLLVFDRPRTGVVPAGAAVDAAGASNLAARFPSRAAIPIAAATTVPMIAFVSFVIFPTLPVCPRGRNTLVRFGCTTDL